MQGSWVTGPNISGSGNFTPLPGYDRMGREIGVPLRYYDRNGNDIPASFYSKSNNNFKIEPDPPAYNEFLSMKKRKDDFDNNFKMPDPILPKFKPEPYKPFRLLEPEIEPIDTFKPKFKIEPIIPIKMDTYEPIDTFKPKFKPEPIIPMKMETYEPFDIFKQDKKKKSSWNSLDLNNF